MPQPPKKTRKNQNIRTWIRQRTSPYDFGVKVQAGNPAHVNKNDDIKYHVACLKSGWYGRRLSRLKNADMSDHFSGQKTYYFTADGRSATPEVLVNIDIDCHGSGSLAGAIAFAEHLRSTKFPDLYFEASTNGNGVHGYLLVQKGDLGDEGLNSALSRLDKWLKAELARGKWDVENVEVKGQSPEFTWGRAKYELQSYKSGQLAKLPREASVRADELRGTTRIKVGELRRLQVPTVNEPVDSVVRQAEKGKRKSVVSVQESDNWGGVASVVSEKAKETNSGSIAGRHFGPEELAKLGGGYLTLAKGLLGGVKLVATGRRVVTEEDMAIFLMILRFFSLNMNADGSLPVARWREMWKALFGADDVNRAWCHHRFARIRHLLSDKDLLSWQDESFVIGVYVKDGRFVPGRAAKWKGSVELMAMMDAASEQVVEVVASVDVEEKEEGGSTLYGHNQTHHDIEHAEIEMLDTLITQQTVNELPPATGPGQSTSFDILFESLGLWSPVPRPRFAGYSTGPYRMAA